MGRRKQPAPGVEERWAVSVGEPVRDRLAEFVRAKYDGNWTRFADAMGQQVATVERWKPAGKGWPSLDGMRALASLRLSLDWLLTGLGSMELSATEPPTPLPELLDHIRRELQRATGVGEEIASQAFNRMLFDLKAPGVLRLAAEGARREFTVHLDAFIRADVRRQLVARILERVDQLEAHYVRKEEPVDRDLLAEVRTQLAAFVPEWVPNSSPSTVTGQVDDAEAPRSARRPPSKQSHNAGRSRKRRRT